MSTATLHIEKKKALIPQLRFQEFDGEWQSNKMEEMAQFKAGYAFKSEQMLSKKSNYQLLKMSNVYQNELRLDRNPSFWKTIDAKQKEFLLKKGDSILTLTGTVGKKDYGYSIKIEDDNKFLLNQRLVLLRERQNKSDNSFISYLISNERFLFYFFAEAKGGTGNQTNVSTEDVKNIKLNFPTLPEQQKIASFLSSVNEKIQQLSRKKELLSQYKKGVMQQLFSGKLRFKDKNGDDYSDWEEKPFFDLFIEILDFRGRTPLKIGMEWGGEILSLSANNVKNGYIDINAEGNMGSDELYQKWMGKVNLEKGDIVFTMEAPLGKALLIPDNQKYILSQRVVAFKTIQEVSNQFLIQLIWSNQFQNEIEKLSTGSTAKGINQKSLKKVKIMLPSFFEQQKIAKFLSNIDLKIEGTSQQINQTQSLKKGLLQQLFV